MDNRCDGLNVILREDVKVVNPGEIDAVIEKMIQESKSNYAEIEGMALDCSAALSSAENRSAAMAERGFFKKKWDKITGKDDKLRCSIEKDQIAAQYAMQQTIKCVLKECTQNQKLSLAIKEKLENEILRIEKEQIDSDKETTRIREALVRFYGAYLDESEKLRDEIQRRNRHDSIRCEKCREEIRVDQVVCPSCGTIQTLKLETLPMNSKNELLELARLMRAGPEEWDNEITWSLLAKKYANALSKARKIAQNSHVLEPESQLDQDISALIKKCRSAEFQIAIVGVLKAGKSMLLNALLGTELAAVGINSKTAALTKFRSSSRGHYVKVRFYSNEEWSELCRSAQAACVEGEGSKDKDISLVEKLQLESVREASRKWVGHPTLTHRFENLEDLKEETKRWTAADSNDHLFASEVEVGVDRAIFDMPEEVVFVDTPGLEDPVRYRSRITENYINQANAVLVAVELHALTEETRRTITKVMDIAGSNKKKVYIIGTQKDKQNNFSNCDEILEGEGGWIERLVECHRYKTKREASSQLFAVSAYLHLCMKKVLQMPVSDLLDESKFSLNDYSNLESSIKKTLQVRRYNLEDLQNDPDTIRKITDEFGIERLKKRIESSLISQYRELKVRDIANEYARCKRALTRKMNAELTERKNKISIARKGAEALASSVESVKEEKEALENSKRQIEQTLDRLKEFTDTQIQNLKN